ncbi:sensor histidine kinase [Noviherbaspirillum aerium]|uniref:sensor histidine kinase n=1 Tax=Noviherbaspirillum aerium TaxID=2588497 RepID=UPI00124E6C57|nr:sensor histidine kinase [Noviherbaspirillum aerium]
MTFASDQQLDDDKLSANARRMLALREAVLQEWGQRLRATVKEAEHLPHPIMINTFPGLYDNIAEAITPGYARSPETETNTVASEHGGERARLTNYNAQAVVSEYQLLRWTIFDVLREHGVQLNSDEFAIINASIDNSIRDAVNAFALAQSALRERFVAALTHDLRNPLATAVAAADLIKHSTDPEKMKSLADRILSNLSRMDGMIQNLLDAIVFQTGERLRLRIEPFDMLELTREVAEQFASIHGALFEVDGSPVNGHWDREAVRRCIENLANNAVKYGTPGSPVRFSVTALHGRAVVSVHNEGPAIPPDQMESVFQVFRRAVSAKEGGSRGWGIGLPYVRGVVESHGGSVGVDSTAQRGTTFIIDMPVDARPFQHAPTLAE